MWRKDSDDEPRWDDTYWSRRRRRSKSELLALLAPLIRQLERVDGLTARFRSGAACVADLGRLNDLLAQEFTLLEDGRPRKVSLVKPPELRDALHWISTDLHLEIILRTAPKQDVIRVTATGPLVADDVDALHGLETAIRNDLHRQVRRKR
mgnify:CR=1 FL=1